MDGLNTPGPVSGSHENLRSRTGQAYLLFAVSLVLVVTVGAAVQLVSLTWGLAVTEVALILAPAALFVRRKGLPVTTGLGWRPLSVRDAVLAVALGVSGWGMAAALELLAVPLLGQPPAVPGLEARSGPQLLWLLVCAAMLPGLCEESLFRGAIQGVLRRHGARRAVVVSALLFAVYHLNPWLLLPAFFLGLVYGTLVVGTGSTLSAVLAHAATNATALTVSYLLRDRPEPAAYPLMALLAAGCLLTVPALWWRTRGRRPEAPALAAVPAAVGRVWPWVAGLAGAAVALVLGTLLVAGLTLVRIHTLGDDHLEPQYRRGDHLVLFTAGAAELGVELDLEAGDVVQLERGGEVVLLRVVRVDGDEVTVREGGGEMAVRRERIRAKVVHAVRGNEGPGSTHGP